MYAAGAFLSIPERSERGRLQDASHQRSHIQWRHKSVGNRRSGTHSRQVMVYSISTFDE